MKGTVRMSNLWISHEAHWVHTSCHSGLVFSSPSQTKCENEEIYGCGGENVLVIPWSSIHAHPLAAFKISRTNIFTACKSLNQGWVRSVCAWIPIQITHCQCMRAYGCGTVQVHTVKMWLLTLNCNTRWLYLTVCVSEVGLVSYLW